MKKPVVLWSILAAVLVIGAGIVIFVVSRPLHIAVPAERVRVYRELLGAWKGLPALNVQIDEISNSAPIDEKTVHEAVIDPFSYVKPVQTAVQTGSANSSWATGLASRLPLSLVPVLNDARVLPLSLDPLLLFKRSAAIPPKKPEWILAGKDDEILGRLIAWASTIKEPVELGEGLSFLATLATTTGRVQKTSFSFPISDALQIFRSGTGQAILLTLSQYRAVEAPLQVTLLPSSLPELQVGGNKTLSSSASLRALVFDNSVNSGTALDVVQRLSLPDAQRALADVSKELAAVLDAPVRDAADHTARQMLIASRHIIGPTKEARLLAAGRSVLVSPAELASVRKEFK